MDVSAITDLYGKSATAIAANNKTTNSQVAFSSMLDNVMSLLGDTNALQKNAEKEEIAFALGETNNTHDLLIAEQKAVVALQYTVAVRDKVLESYKEIMNMQI